MRRSINRWVGVLFASMLGACAAPQPSAVRTYDLGAIHAPARSTPRLDAPITILPVMAPGWLQDSAIVYRLAYAVPPYPQVYALSRWVAPPADLLTLRLREEVAAVNAGFTLTSTNGNLSGYELEVTLEEFTHEFQSPTSSRCFVQLRATLLDRSTGRIVDQQTFRAQQPAPTPDAPGGVRGLTAATDRIIDTVLAWLGSHPDAGRATNASTRPEFRPPVGESTN
jgi:cholesterol transport system auxiliary component